MTRTLEAVFENGAFRPLEPVSCREQERVLLTVQSIVPTSENLPDEETKPNLQMLAALRKIEVIQQGMSAKAGKSTLEYLREAREGGMYGVGTGGD